MLQKRHETSVTLEKYLRLVLYIIQIRNLRNNLFDTYEMYIETRSLNKNGATYVSF